MNIDLNLDNYSLEDLLSLFKLNYEFSIDDLKRAKRQVLMSHPDKSHLDKKYFLFFSSAFKLVYSIYQYRKKSQTDDITKQEYIIEKDDEKKRLLNKLLSHKGEKFNKIFNDLFEKYNIKTDEIESGYGDWLKSDEDMDNTETTMQGIHKTFEDKRKNLQIITSNIKTLEGNHHSLTGEKPEEYSSSIFSSMQYEDLQKAHRETIIPVSTDYKKNTSLEELKYARSKAVKPLSMSQAKEKLRNQQMIEEKTNTERAYKLLCQDELIKKNNDSLMSVFKQLDHQ